MNRWSFVTDTLQGISHANQGRECQDFALVAEGTDCLVAALADGIGSRDHSEIAAEAAVKELCRLFSEYRSDQLDAIFSDAVLPDACDQVKNRVVSVLTAAIDDAAGNHNLAVSSMDCTLVFVCVIPRRNQAMIGRIGDSAVCVIRKQGKSEAFSAKSLSANRTNTVLQADAAKYLDIRVLDLVDDDIVAIVLTSDGLNNELYMKGSNLVCHSAQDYVNALLERTPDVAKETIAKRLSLLTRDYADIFRDDISYVVLSRSREPVSIPADPTWLCTCGTRNHLWETYCRGCHMDFVKLYRNVNFAGEDKVSFFSRLNADEARERRTIGLPAKSTAFSPVCLALYVFPILVLLILCWNLWVSYSLKLDIHTLTEQVTIIQDKIAEMDDRILSTDDADTKDAERSLAEETAALNAKLDQFLNQAGSPESEPPEESTSVDTIEPIT